MSFFPDEDELDVHPSARGMMGGEPEPYYGVAGGLGGMREMMDGNMNEQGPGRSRFGMGGPGMGGPGMGGPGMGGRGMGGRGMMGGPGMMDGPDMMGGPPPGYEMATERLANYSDLSLGPPGYQYREFPGLDQHPMEGYDPRDDPFGGPRGRAAPDPAYHGQPGGPRAPHGIDWANPEMMDIGGSVGDPEMYEDEEGMDAGIIPDERRGRMRQMMSNMGFTGRSAPMRSPLGGMGPYESQGFGEFPKQKPYDNTDA